jgi:hypothetical protein
MSSKPRDGRRAVAAPARGGVSGFDFLADFGREQLALVMDASCAMFRGFEAMRTIQQQAAHQASARHEAAAHKLRAPCAPADLMAIPFGLLQDDLQNATRYWQELAATALETQTEMMGCTSHLFNADTALEAASAVEALDAIPGVSQLFPRRPNGLGRRARTKS